MKDVIDRLTTVIRVMSRKQRPMETLRLLRRRPALLLAVNLFEMAHLASGRMPIRLKALAQIKTSALIGCPF
ncbi:hypothetical protein EPN44_13180 [bacterium]|nr:MAG: hypothetical protein EPN44_13180 [bacterium]